MKKTLIIFIANLFVFTLCVENACAQSKRDRIEQLLWHIDSLKLIQTEEAEIFKNKVLDLTVRNTTAEREIREAISLNDGKKGKIKELEAVLSSKNTTYYSIGDQIIDCKTETAAIKEELAQLSNTPIHSLHNQLKEGKEIQFKLVENLLGSMNPGPVQGCMILSNQRMQLSYDAGCSDPIPFSMNRVSLDKGEILLDFTMHYFGESHLTGYIKYIEGSYYLYYGRYNESVAQIERFILE